MPVTVRWIWATPSGQAFRCNLRCAPISAAIPVASVSFAHCALRLPRARQRRAEVSDTVPASTVRSSRPRFAQRSPRRVPLPRPLPVHGPGHFPRRRCGLRPSPACASRRAWLSAVVRTRPRTPSASCFALPPLACPLRRPLKRRGGSHPPGSPASIPPSLFSRFQAVSTPCGGNSSHATQRAVGPAIRRPGCPDVLWRGQGRPSPSWETRHQSGTSACLQ